VAKKIKRIGQTTVWIIFAIVLVIAIILLIYFLKDVNLITPPIADAPFEMQSFLQGCTGKSVLESVDIMLPQAGFIQPRNAVRFDGGDVEYICETFQYYDPCVQQHPMLLNEMEMEIKNYILDDIRNCFDEMEEEFEERGWDMNFVSPLEFDVKLKTGKVVLDITKGTIIESGEDKKTFDSFHIEILSPVYDLAVVALEIASQEGNPNRCYFEHVGYSLTYPRYKIDMYGLFADGTKVYTINDKKSGKFMRIATRSCVVPRGV